MSASRYPRPRMTPLILCLATLVLVPSLAAAQGGLFKKAKDKLVPKPAENGPAPAFNDRLLELTDERVNTVLKGVAAGRQLKGPDGATVADLNRRADQAFRKREELLKGKDDEQSRYQDEVRKHDECFQEAMDVLRAKHDKEMAARQASMTAADIQYIQKISIEIGRMYSEHDTAGVVRAQMDMMKKFGVDPKADTAQAQAKCGKAPARPAWLSEAETQLQKGNNDMAAARSLEQQGLQAQVEQSGLTETQYGLARERIIAFVNADGKPASSWRFSSSERDVLSKRIDEIRKALIG